MADPTDPGATLRTLRIMFGAMLFSLGVYVGIGFLMSRELTSLAHLPDTPLPQALFIAVCVLSAGMLGAIPFARRRLMKARLNRIGQRYTAMCIVSWGICVAVGILGLLLTLVSREPMLAVGFGAAAALNLLLYLPTAAGLAAAAGPGEEPGT